MNIQPAPHQRLTYAEYVLLPDDGNQHEIIDGVHYMNPAPTTYHQTVSRRIQFALYTQIELPGLGQVFDAPTDVELNPYTVVQPDLVLVLTAHKHIITPTKIKGIPDLLIEILSPGTLEKDRALKRKSYETHRVPEYWIVDPLEHLVEQLVLNQDRYVLREHGDSITPASIPNAEVKLNEIW